jgi:hypothetical protein
MTTKVKYNRELLEQICERDKCIVDFEKIEKYNRDIRIEFVCYCGNTHNKTFRMLSRNNGGYCAMCSIQKSISKIKQTCIYRYGVENPAQSKEIKDKIKQVNLERYGYESHNQSNNIKEKKKQSIIQKYGVIHQMYIPEVKSKIKQTCLDRYGVEHNSQSQQIKEKKIHSCLFNYGVSYPQQSQIILKKSIKTCKERYGVERPAQNAEISEKQFKNSFKLKPFKFPCNNTIQVQGYEPLLLDMLVKEGYTFDDIITKRTEVPDIWYNKNDKKCI